MFRAPSQRVASAHAFGNHGFGMQHDARMPYAQLGGVENEQSARPG